MRLTKKRAIELTLGLWQWLYKNPDKQKFDWPEWRRNGGSYPNASGWCFACEYALQKGCGSCPLLPLWQGGCLSAPNSSYALWKIASTPGRRRKYAKQIVDFCKKELAK